MIDFELASTDGKAFKLSEFKGKTIVLYFYPKDATPGCTTEAQQFRDLHDQFKVLNTEVFGISRDSVKSHQNFRTRQSLPFELLSDKEEVACKLFDVLKDKPPEGTAAPDTQTQAKRIQRSTFVLDGDGAVRREWRGVKVPGHAQEVLDFVKTLKYVKPLK